MGSSIPRLGVVVALLSSGTGLRAESNTARVVDGVISNANNAYISVGSSGSGNTLDVVNGGVLSNVNQLTIGNGSSAHSNRVTVSGSGSKLTSSSLYSGYYGDGNLLVVSNGAVVRSGRGEIGYEAGSSGNVVVVTGAGSSWSNTSDGIKLGYAGGTGNRLIVADGARVWGYLDISVGASSGSSSNNTVIVTDTGSLLRTGRRMYVGDSSQGNSVIVSNGGAFRADSLTYIGAWNTRASNNLVCVTGAGSTWTSAAAFYMGNYSEGNRLVLEDGGKLAALSTFYVGETGSASNNEVLVTGAGSCLLSSSTLRIGSSGGANRMVVSNGATVMLSGSMILGANGSSHGNEVIVTGAGSIVSNLNGECYVGLNGSSNRLVLADGGRLEGSTIYVGIAASSTGNVLRVEGGYLRTTNSSGSVLDVQRGALALNGGTVETDKLLVTNAPNASISFDAGTLRIRHGAMVATGSPLVVGDGTQAATLQLRGTNLFADGLTISDHATLAAAGRLTTALMLADGSSLSPGWSPGSLTNIGSVVFSPAAELLWELGQPGVKGGASNDLLVVTGNLTLDGILYVTGGAGFDAGTYTLATYSGTLTNNGLSVGAMPDGYQGTVQAGSGSVTLVVGIIPEPAAAGLITLLGFLGLATRRRRQWNRRSSLRR